MRQLKLLWRSFFDIREGERLRTLFMSLYLLFVLFAYYILKTVSRGLFLGKFDIDKLPILYMLIAAVGGVLAYLYTKLAVRVSLAAAVAWASFISIGMLVVLWFLIRSTNQAWIYYFFNIWVSLFSIVLVSQGWLVAALGAASSRVAANRRFVAHAVGARVLPLLQLGKGLHRTWFSASFVSFAIPFEPGG